MTAVVVPVDLSGSRSGLTDGPGRSPADVYLGSLAPGSRRTMRHALAVIVELAGPGWTVSTFPWHLLSPAQTSLVREHLAETTAPATANKALAALRRVLAQAWRLGLMGAEDYRRAADLPGIRHQRLPAGRAVSGGELRSLFGACGADPAGLRDAALLAILYGAGLRRAEAVALTLEDLRDDALTVRSGKGRKDRTAHLPPGAGELIQRWLGVRGLEPGALLCPVTKGGRVIRRHMSSQALYERLRRLSVAAGVAHLSPHDLRRSFVSDLLDAGADIATVQQMAGHASVTTTARYDRRGEHAKARAASLLQVPTS